MFGTCGVLKKVISQRFSAFLFGVVMCFLFVLAFAKPESSLTSTVYRQEMLVQQQRLAVINQSNNLRELHLSRLKNRLEQTKTKSRIVDKEQLQRAKIELTVLRTDLANVANELLLAQKRLKDMQQRHDKSKNSLMNAKVAAKDGHPMSSVAITELNRENDYLAMGLQWKNTEVNALRYAQALIRKNIEFQVNWLNYLLSQYQQSQRQLRVEELLEQAEEIQSRQQKLLAEQTRLTHQAQKYEANNQSQTEAARKINQRIFEIQQEIDLGQFELTLADITHRHDELMEIIIHDTDTINELNFETREADSLISDLKNLQATLERKIDLIYGRKSIEKENYAQQIITESELSERRMALDNFLQEYQSQLATSKKELKEIQKRQTNISQQLEAAISKRQVLPGFDLKAWLNVGKNFLQLPYLFVRFTQKMYHQTTISLTDGISTMAVVSLIAGEIGLLLIYWLCRNFFRKIVLQFGKDSSSRTTVRIAHVVVRLLNQNLFFPLLALSIVLLFFFVKIPYQSYALLFYLILIWFVFVILRGVTRIFFLESQSDDQKRDVRFYYRLQRVLFVGAITACLTTMAHYLPVGFEVKNLLDRFCMVFFLLIAWVLWRGRTVIPSLVHHYWGETRRYLVHSVRIFCFLIPLILFSNAVIGLLGYMALAWKMGFYQVVFLLVAAIYLVLRGLWIDLVDVSAGFVIRHINNGWLWSEALLKPFDHVMRILLFFSAWFLLFALYGWNKEAFIIHESVKVLNKPLFTIASTAITPFAVIETFVILAVVYWFSKWAREFAYRWLFARIEDKGLRNSLSVFGQYSLVVIGFLILLKVLGINFTALNVILGGLAVGLGFGLRDFANNFVSGILLLIERPVREGDTVSIGNYEGEVVHIGMRSMIVKTWDHMEVLVPNSETFNKPFMNWTRQDNIVRTVVTIKINRTDDPNLVKQTIESILKRVPDVVTFPEPEVFLMEIGETVLQFEVRYFINLAVSKSRAKVRSEVLFAVWRQFSEMGIEPPYPVQDVYIRGLPKPEV